MKVTALQLPVVLYVVHGADRDICVGYKLAWPVSYLNECNIIYHIVHLHTSALQKRNVDFYTHFPRYESSLSIVNHCVQIIVFETMQV